MARANKSQRLKLYIPWRVRPLPLDWTAEFERQAPLKMEIGFGNGEYLCGCAARDPDSNYIGVEMTWGSIKRACGICFRDSVANVRLLWDDARTALAWGVGERRLESITALYPCPWPKRRHAKFRLFQPAFVALCNSRLVDGGTLTVVTDSADYRDEMLETNTLANTGMESQLEFIPASFETKYEKKWQEEGQSEFFRLTFTKKVHQNIPNPEVLTVKHHVVPEFDPVSFSPKDEKSDFSVQFKQFIFDQKQQIGLLEVHTHEETIEQHFYIRIKKQENGWKIHPAGGPPLLPVPSVQRALDIVMECAGKTTD
jgi:tRNA (guanine-N7-)-methyltransferase